MPTSTTAGRERHRAVANDVLPMIGFLVAGFVIGVLAHLVWPGEKRDLPTTLGLGIGGSLVGGLLARFLGTGGLLGRDVIGLAMAVVVAVLFIGLAQGVAVKRPSTGAGSGPRIPRQLDR